MIESLEPLLIKKALGYASHTRGDRAKFISKDGGNLVLVYLDVPEHEFRDWCVGNNIDPDDPEINVVVTVCPLPINPAGEEE